MHIGVIGLGSIGRRHVGNLLSLGCDVYGFDEDVRAYPKAKEQYPNLVLNPVAFNGRMDGTPYLDAVVIATPWNTHLEWVEWAVARRLPFFVEKPLGSLEQLPRWREIAAMDLPINQVGYQCRFHPKAQALKLLFHEPDYGTCWCCVDMRTWPGTYGPFLLEASHEIDMALHLGARLDDVRAWHVAGKHVIGIGAWNVHMADRSEYCRSWSVRTHSDEGATVEFNCPEELGDQMYVDEMKHFLECVQRQVPTSVPLADGLRVLEVIAQVEARCPSCA
jgi:predicted dehydrogenase